jgi:hypothetical protein
MRKMSQRRLMELLSVSEWKQHSERVAKTAPINASRNPKNEEQHVYDSFFD